MLSQFPQLVIKVRKETMCFFFFLDRPNLFFERPLDNSMICYTPLHRGSVRFTFGLGSLGTITVCTSFELKREVGR